MLYLFRSTEFSVTAQAMPSVCNTFDRSPTPNNIADSGLSKEGRMIKEYRVPDLSCYPSVKCFSDPQLKVLCYDNWSVIPPHEETT